MSQVRVHNFSISLDGFATGDGIGDDAPFGHAGTRLHEWMFATRFGMSMLGRAGGSLGVDNAFAERHEPGIGAEIMGRGKFGPQTGPWTDVGTEDEWRGWWGRTVLRDFLAEALVDTVHVAQVPIVLGRGVRLWDGLEELEARYDVETVASPSGITHLSFTRRT